MKKRKKSQAINFQKRRYVCFSSAVVQFIDENFKLKNIKKENAIEKREKRNPFLHFIIALAGENKVFLLHIFKPKTLLHSSSQYCTFIIKE